MEENNLQLKKTIATGFSETEIKIYELQLSKQNLIAQFLRNFVACLTAGQKKTILNHKESRLDENLDFFIRFDKDVWMQKEMLELTDSGKCFHLRMSIAAFPRKREVALVVVDNIFK